MSGGGARSSLATGYLRAAPPGQSISQRTATIYCVTFNDASMKTSVIIRDPEILSGIPVFEGTRVPAKNLIDYLEHGRSLEEFLEDFPTVRREQAIAALQAVIEPGTVMEIVT
jgi:uncharacterized protein (DUF433 family)